MKRIHEASLLRQSNMLQNYLKSTLKNPIGKPIALKAMQIQISQSPATEVTGCKTAYMNESKGSLEVHVMIAGVHIEQSSNLRIYERGRCHHRHPSSTRCEAAKKCVPSSQSQPAGWRTALPVNSTLLFSSTARVVPSHAGGHHSPDTMPNQKNEET